MIILKGKPVVSSNNYFEIQNSGFFKKFACHIKEKWTHLFPQIIILKGKKVLSSNNYFKMQNGCFIMCMSREYVHVTRK